MEYTSDYNKVVAWRCIRGFAVLVMLLSIANALHPIINGSFLGVIVAWLSWPVIVLCGFVTLVGSYASMTDDGVKWYDLLSEKNEPGGSIIFALFCFFVGLLSLKLWHPVITGHEPGAIMGLVLLCSTTFIGMQILLFHEGLQFRYRPLPSTDTGDCTYYY